MRTHNLLDYENLDNTNLKTLGIIETMSLRGRMRVSLDKSAKVVQEARLKLQESREIEARGNLAAALYVRREADAVLQAESSRMAGMKRFYKKVGNRLKYLRQRRDYVDRYGDCRGKSMYYSKEADLIRVILRTEESVPEIGDHVVALLKDVVRLGTLEAITPGFRGKFQDCLVNLGGDKPVRLPEFVVVLYRRRVDHPGYQEDIKRFEETRKAWETFNKQYLKRERDRERRRRK